MKTNLGLTVVLSSGTIQVGRDFVEAVTGTMRSHGLIELRRGEGFSPMCYKWVSTQDIAETERILRNCAARESLRVTSLQSQAT